MSTLVGNTWDFDFLIPSLIVIAPDAWDFDIHPEL
jgi:hypothetical protein